MSGAGGGTVDAAGMLPESENLPVGKLAAAFSDVTTSYKFFWFLSILDALGEAPPPAATPSGTGPVRLAIKDLLVRMVLNAWYPLYCKVRLGQSDALGQLRLMLMGQLGLPEDEGRGELGARLALRGWGQACEMVAVLGRYVPFKFLSPWVKGTDPKVMAASSDPALCCLYAIQDRKVIEINPRWLPYLIRNAGILRDFANWNLLRYLQRRNPHDLYLASKLVRPDSRDPLTKQRRFWQGAMEGGARIICPYTGQRLGPGAFDLDHFIPWRYVCHDLMWNLTPADPSVNRSKGDGLPDPGLYLGRFALNQRESLRFFTRGKIPGRGYGGLLEDYLSLGVTVEELAGMGDQEVVSFFDRLIRPLYLQAGNMGFGTWQLKSGGI